MMHGLLSTSTLNDLKEFNLLLEVNLYIGSAFHLSRVPPSNLLSNDKFTVKRG